MEGHGEVCCEHLPSTRCAQTPLSKTSFESMDIYGPASAGKCCMAPDGLITPSMATDPRSEKGLQIQRDQLQSLNSSEMKCRRVEQKRYSIASAIFQRECKATRCSLPRPFLGRLRSSLSTTYTIDNSNNGGSPPFSLHFGRTNRAETLFVADEDGFVSLIKTSASKGHRSSSPPYAWLCHRNAIFDVALTEGDDLLATASGDQSIRIWDLSASHPALKSTLRGHVSSVKAVKFRPSSQTELVSGAREGNIFLWDTRFHGNGPRFESQPVQRILAAHVKEFSSSKSYLSGSQPSNRRKIEQNHHSVTSVVFLDDTVLASAGANDGTIKLWDLRKTCFKDGKPIAIKSFLSRQASATGRPRGISSLALNSTKTKLLASSQDHHLYVFDCILPEQDPITFSGHVNNSFYVKSSFSSDDRYIISGSSDYDVYLWDVKHPLLAPLRLKGHVGEVSDVAWCPTDMTKLASSSDDTTVRIWSLDQFSGTENLMDKQADGFVGRGIAEAPPSWSTPSHQSEDDTLACLETMLESETSWSTAAAVNSRSIQHRPRRETSLSPQQAPEAPELSRFIASRNTSPASFSPCQSPPLKQATLDDLWKLRGAGFHRPVPRAGRVDCNRSPKQISTEKSSFRDQSTESYGNEANVSGFPSRSSGGAVEQRILQTSEVGGNRDEMIAGSRKRSRFHP